MEKQFLKAVATALSIMAIVVLIICGMDFFPTLSDVDKFLMGFIYTIAIMGLFAIAVGVNIISIED